MGNDDTFRSLKSTRASPYSPYLRRSILLKSVLKIKRMFPSWGYRRIWSYLRYSRGIEVSKNRVFSLLKMLGHRDQHYFHDLGHSSLLFETREKFQHLWHMDVIKLRVSGYGYICVIFVMDTTTGTILGHYVGLKCQSWHWLFALNKAMDNLCLERDLKTRIDICLVTDTKAQPTSVSFMRSCWDLGITHKIRRLDLTKDIFSKEFQKWVRSKMSASNNSKSLKAILTALAVCIRDFNRARSHSTIDFSCERALSLKCSKYAIKSSEMLKAC